MKIIFLDIDGVLNSRKWAEAHIEQHPSDHRFMREKLDKDAVARVQKIIDATGAKVVISSTWRILNSLESIKKILSDHGLRGDVIGVTPQQCLNRGSEIQEWLTEHAPIDSFVILDDDDDMAHLMDRLVDTSFETGLQDEHVEQAIQLLS
jgi:hypothetical protein